MSKEHNETGNDEAVGYGRPPNTHRFKKGQSGNPKGRPRGARNLKTIVATEQKQKVMVTEGGRSRKLTKQEAIIKTLHAKALKGDLKAITLCISLNERFLLADDDGAPRAALPDEDAMILDLFVRRQQQRPAEDQGGAHG